MFNIVYVIGNVNKNEAKQGTFSVQNTPLGETKKDKSTEMSPIAKSVKGTKRYHGIFNISSA